ncbi:hypothetical protein FQR65_LT16053 [Abscondita terminalis]|nr:hypothetical protein FQR65_LT16053 [Abscondita terminalis]
MIRLLLGRTGKRETGAAYNVLKERGHLRSEQVSPFPVIPKRIAIISVETIADVICRIRLDKEEETISRLADSVQTAFFEGKGVCTVDIDGAKHFFSDKFELDGITFEEPTPNFFSFNNPYGACRRCEGYGKIIGIDPDLVIPDKSRSVYDGAIAPWRGEKMGEWLQENGLAKDKPTFAHLIQADEGMKGYELIKTTTICNQLTLDLAKAAIENEKMGNNPTKTRISFVIERKIRRYEAGQKPDELSGSPELPADRKILIWNVDKVKEEIIKVLKKEEGIAYVVGCRERDNMAIPQPIRERIINGYNMKRSGVIQIVLEPQWYDGSPRSTGTTHGTWTPYDSHIPLIFMGWGIKTGQLQQSG